MAKRRALSPNGGMMQSLMHLTVLLGSVAVLALTVWSMRDIVRTQRAKPAALVAWVLIVIALPVVGVVAWLAWARPRTRTA